MSTKESKKKQATLSLQVVDSGKYKAEVFKKDEATGELVLQRESEWSENIITDAALNSIAAGSSVDSDGSIQIGTGTTPAVGADTSLGAAGPNVAVDSSVVETSYPTTPYLSTRTYTCTFAEGAATGTWTEIGKWTGTSASGTLVSRSLFRDEFGDPTSITVLSGELLRITYKVSREAPSTDTTETVGGYSLTIRPAQVDATTSWSPLRGLPGTAAITYATGIVGVTSSPTGSNNSAGTVTRETYVADSFESSVYCKWGINRGNEAVESVLIGSGSSSCLFQIGLSPAIPKTDSDILEITYKTTVGRPA